MLASPFSVLPRPSSVLRSSVVIPARDEAANVALALDALAHSCDGGGRRLDPRLWEVLLWCNNCRDDTAQIARAWQARHPRVALHVLESALPASEANIGTVRRLLMDGACARLEGVLEKGAPRFIASTDADTRVERTWLWATECELRAGAQAVGGRVLVERGAENQTRRTYLLDTVYHLLSARLEGAICPVAFDSWPRHFQFFGASLAVTPAAYRSVGGVPRAACLEDVALGRALSRADVPLRHSPWVRVRTSARQSGRVACGLSTQLSEWSDSQAWLVPSGAEVAWRARLKRELQRAFGHEKSDFSALWPLARELKMCPSQLRSRVRNAAHFGALWDDVWDDVWSNPALRAVWSPVPVEEALSQLRSMLEGVREK